MALFFRIFPGDGGVFVLVGGALFPDGSVSDWYVLWILEKRLLTITKCSSAIKFSAE